MVIELFVESRLLAEDVFVQDFAALTERPHPLVNGARARLTREVGDGIAALTLLILPILVFRLHHRIAATSTDRALCSLPDAASNLFCVGEVSLVESAAHVHACAHHFMVVVLILVVEIALRSEDLPIASHVIIRHSVTLLLSFLLLFLPPYLLLHHAIKRQLQRLGSDLLIHHVRVVRKPLFPLKIILRVSPPFKKDTMSGSLGSNSSSAESLTVASL